MHICDDVTEREEGAAYPWWPGVMDNALTWQEEAEHCEGIILLQDQQAVGNGSDRGSGEWVDGDGDGDGRDAAGERGGGSLVSRRVITANLTVASLIEGEEEAPELWNYADALSAVDAAIEADPTVLNPLETDLHSHGIC